MGLTIYNTISRSKEPFVPTIEGEVKMYCCGVTVYDYCHLGHARSYIVWDTIRRYLRWCGYSVTYIQNFTDIDDKILNRAKETDSTMAAVADRFVEAYFEDIRQLNVLDADDFPRVTGHIPEIIQLISDLESRGFAYAVEGDVYFRVRKFSEYGKLSGRKLDDMMAGASGRVEVEDAEDTKKEDPFDFALWKGAKEGEPSWDSPWGKGRPGWHIECSAMIRSKLGETIDIHGGGSDLTFPHHENEIAQSECAHDRPLAKYWLHNGMVTVDGTKMSKSLGNFVTIRELLTGTADNNESRSEGMRKLLAEPLDPLVIRLFVQTVQYRMPMDFSPQAIESAQNSWQTIKEALAFGYEYGDRLNWTTIEAISPEELSAAEAAIVPSEPISPKVADLPTIESPATAAEAEVKIPSFIPEGEATNIVLPFFQLPSILKQFYRDNRLLVIIAIALFFTQFPIRLINSIVLNFERIPLIPSIMRLVGLFATIMYIFNLDFRQKSNEVLGGIRRSVLSTFSGSKKADKNKDVTAEADVKDIKERFKLAMHDDFNFPRGLAILFELAKDLQKERNILIHSGSTTANPGILKYQWETLVELADVFGLKFDNTAKTNPTNGLTDAEITTLIAERATARQDKNYAESDRIRDELKNSGIALIDRPDGTTGWQRS